MKLTLQRGAETPSSTPGTLSLDGVFQCYTLELPWRENVHDISCIPAGQYKIILADSPRFGQVVPHIQDVPGRANILVHWGNYTKDTAGCVLVGQTRAPDFVGNSRAAFSALMSQLSTTQEEITIDVVHATT